MERNQASAAFALNSSIGIDRCHKRASKYCNEGLSSAGDIAPKRLVPRASPGVSNGPQATEVMLRGGAQRRQFDRMNTLKV